MHARLIARGAICWVAFFLALITGLSTGCQRRSGESAATPSTLTNPTSVPTEDELRAKIDRSLDLAYHHRRLNLRDHAAWQIVHGTLAFKRDYQIEDESGNLIFVLDYLMNGGRMKGWVLEPGDVLDKEAGRRGVRAILETGSKTGQGHPDQWLGYLSDCGLQPEDTIRVGGDTFTINDYLGQIQWDVPRNADREFSWTIMALTAYYPTTHSWVASDGKTWTTAQLVEIEANHELNSSACGGSHRITGLTLALNRHLAQGGSLEGPWKLADDKIQECIRRAREYQNDDGSLSSNYFARPGRSPDLAQALGTTGHVLEFLALATSESQFAEPWIKRAATRLCDLFETTKELPIECGALYHAAHSLVIYRKRAYGEAWKPMPSESAQRVTETRQ